MATPNTPNTTPTAQNAPPIRTDASHKTARTIAETKAADIKFPTLDPEPKPTDFGTDLITRKKSWCIYHGTCAHSADDATQCRWALTKHALQQGLPDPFAAQKAQSRRARGLREIEFAMNVLGSVRGGRVGKPKRK